MKLREAMGIEDPEDENLNNIDALIENCGGIENFQKLIEMLAL